MSLLKSLDKRYLLLRVFTSQLCKLPKMMTPKLVVRLQ